MIFKGVQEGKPYADHGVPQSQWAKIPPRQFRLDELVTVTSVLALDKLLSEDSTFYGDLFSHVVRYRGEYYLEDGLHRAVRSALRNRTIVHARCLDLDDLSANPAGVSPQVAPRDPSAPVTPPGTPVAGATTPSPRTRSTPQARRGALRPADRDAPVNPRRTGRTGGSNRRTD